MKIDFKNAFSRYVGRHGLLTSELDNIAKVQIPKVHSAMCAKKSEMVWRSLPYVQDDILSDIKATAKHINDNFDNFVVFGIGGSALGSKMLFNALKHSFYNLLSRKKRKGVRFFVEDNADPDRLKCLFDVIDVKKTMFHVITKSGNTIETMTQFTIVLDMLEKQLGCVKDNIIVTTDKKSGIMKKICNKYGFKTYIVPDGVGGRFSVLSPVGMLSAAVLNLDINELLNGAKDADTACSKENFAENPAYMYAVVHKMAVENGANISVMFPYADGLASMAEWYSQLWAESLGKRYDNYGNVVRFGQTPVRVLGSTDQHSQMQLFNEGPYDKIITFVEVQDFNNEISIPYPKTDTMDAKFVQGQTVNKLMFCECAAAKYALTKNGKMNITIILEKLDERRIGQMLFFFEMATAAAGELLNINAFNQPGVEEGKVATFALMGREGYEDKAFDLELSMRKDEKYYYKF